MAASVASQCEPGRERTLDIDREWDTGKNGVRNDDVHRLGVGPVPHAPSTREVPFDLTVDQWEGNSEILWARCAEKGCNSSRRPIRPRGWPPSSRGRRAKPRRPMRNATTP